LPGQITAIPINHTLDTFNPIAKDSLQFITRITIQKIRHNLEKPDVIGNHLPDQGVFHSPE
jgi:hypothetical protein